MSIQDRIKPYLKYIKISSILSGSGLIAAYLYRGTSNSIGRIINPNVLDREKKYTPEYIYIDDPAYSVQVSHLREREKDDVGLARIWKSLKHSLAWRLLWLCRHGNPEQRNIALQQLANFKNKNNWDCLKLAQALDKNTAVLLARTEGADLRYFLPPPIHIRRAVSGSEILSFKLRDMILAVQKINPHSCIAHFLRKHFSQEISIEMDEMPAKPDNVTISERDMCLITLDALHHHISLFHNVDYHEDLSSKVLISMGILPVIAQLLLKYPNDAEIDLAVLRLLTVLSIHSDLLTDFFINGLIGQLSRLMRSPDIRLASSSAVCLTNLSGEYTYRPGLYLLHPLFRTTKQHTCDILLVHGLRGGVFVTWRQRDKKCAEPVGIIEVTLNETECDPCEEQPKYNLSDPELSQVIQDMIELEDDSLLADFEVVLHDLPIKARREPLTTHKKYTVRLKRIALLEEKEDECNYSLCWPKDWLPQDCCNLRILGVNYWSSLSEWLERCPLQTAEIETRAGELCPTLVAAGVGHKDTPVVWLAHSMGGLIVKQLLVDASGGDSEHRKLSDNTKAVFFYSTPHKGTSLVKMPRAAAAILWPSNDVRQLEENSPVLLDLHEKFISLADTKHWETISFAESKPTLVTAFKVPIRFVESESADLGRGAFYELPLDHLCICKPATRQSILYTTVLEVLRKISKPNEDIRFSYSFIRLFLNFLWEGLRKRTESFLHTLDTAKPNDNELGWLEQKLLEAFTDGFTD